MIKFHFYPDQILKMIYCNTTLFVLLILGICAVHAQDSSKIEIADGTQPLNGKPVYLTEAETVFKQVQNSKIKLADFQGITCGQYDTFRIIDSAEGFFTSKDVKSKAFLYSDCYKQMNLKIQGVIIFENGKRLNHIAYKYSADVKVAAIKDINKNSLEELVIYSEEKIGKNYRKSFRIVEFLSNALKKIGSLEIQNDNNILFALRIYAEKSETPKFFASKFQTDGYKWKINEVQKLIELDVDQIDYAEARKGIGFLKHFVFLTFVLQGLAFIGLFGLLVYEIFFTRSETDEEKQQKLARKEGKSSPTSEDNLPQLTPINCENCGAGVPLRSGEMNCPNCGTKTNAPENYFDIAKTRAEINGKLRKAVTYLNRARILSSGWMRFGILLLSVWLVISMIAMFVFISNENFEPYQSLFSSFSFIKLLITAAGFTNMFWVFSLMFGFMIWSPRFRKALPVIELNEKIGEAETANCLQCGGCIAYQADDLATVCGYCGVETYRAKLAWKLRNLTNNANETARFSLIEAQKSVAESIEEITGTPKVFMFLLILAVVLIGSFYLLAAIFDLLPDSIKEILELISELLNSF